ncbi:helix-turn-helix transcriptional regulator [Lysobacter enzymogenes]|nr:helix-turn-helix transcriptional regulator [Lysobacter enzymogenes]
MSDALSISPRAGEAERTGLDGAAALGEAAARGWARQRRIERRHELELGPGLQFAFATENIAEPTQWSLEHARHTLIVHLDGPMRRLETRIDGAGACARRRRRGRLVADPGRPSLSRPRARRRDRLRRAQHRPGRFRRARARPGRERRAGRADEAPRSVRARHRRAPGPAQRSRRRPRRDAARIAGPGAVPAPVARTRCRRGARAAPAPAPVRLAEPARRRIEDHIQAHLDRRITLDELAGLGGLSTHQLLIAFRHAFGLTPIQYVLAQRLRRVCLRLRGSADDIATIAVENGFSSHSHLSAVFKKRYGLTPNEFRRQG